MIDLFQYQRRATNTVTIGSLLMGSSQPIRIQSMATTNTNDTEASVAQAMRIIEAGGELVRFTTQGTREAENMKNINAGIRALGKDTPLVADVHFNANVADVAAKYCEKVRINPGNYVDPARKFEKLEYTDEEYALELKKIEDWCLSSTSAKKTILPCALASTTVRSPTAYATDMATLQQVLWRAAWNFCASSKPTTSTTWLFPSSRQTPLSWCSLFVCSLRLWTKKACTIRSTLVSPRLVRAKMAE